MLPMSDDEMAPPEKGPFEKTLIELAMPPTPLLKKFLSDPEDTLDAIPGLRPRQKRALLNRDPDLIESELALERCHKIHAAGFVRGSYDVAPNFVRAGQLIDAVVTGEGEGPGSE